MKYINSRRIKAKIVTGQDVNIPAGTSFYEQDNMIYMENGTPVCYKTSQLAHEYFARNDDENGMERGQYTYAIAFKLRNKTNKDGTRQQRFTDEEIETLEKRWKKYLIPEIDVILFNNDFFNADIDELREIAKSVNIRVKEM